MKIKSIKRAFTIVELVIVIAVVAILAAVMIPTFVNIAKRASESADTQLVKNLNTALSLDEAENGKSATCYDALKAVTEYGYTVEKITPTSAGDLLWEQDSNRFVLVSESGAIIYKDSSTTAEISVTPSNFWYVYNSGSDASAQAGSAVSLAKKVAETESQAVTTSKASSVKEEAGVLDFSEISYSIYLAASVSGEVKVTAGVDVGENSGLSIISTTESALEIIIRVNGGSLNVTNEGGTVHLYGSISTPTITADTLELKDVKVTYIESSNIDTVNISAEASVLIDTISEGSVYENCDVIVIDSSTTNTKGESILSANGTSINNSAFQYTYTPRDPNNTDGLFLSDTVIIIPEGVKVIGQAAFRAQPNIVKVVFPESLTTIQISAFYGCSRLEEIEIGPNLKSIGSGAFEGCSSLTKITVSDLSAWCRGGSGSVWSAVEEATLYYNGEAVTELVVPADVATLSSGFAGYKKLTSVSFANASTEIAVGAFEGCTSLTHVVLPSALKSVTDSAFEGCNALTSVTIPSSVKTIGGKAFMGTGLVSITIPYNVYWIGQNAFADCSSLTTIRFENSDGWSSATWQSPSVARKYEKYFDGLIETAPALTTVTLEDSALSKSSYDELATRELYNLERHKTSLGK